MPNKRSMKAFFFFFSGDIGYVSYFMPFFDFFLSLTNIVIIDVCLKSSIFLCLWRAILMCDSTGALSLFLAFSV